MRRQSKRNRQHHQGRREREMRKKPFHCPPPEFQVFEISLQGDCQGTASVGACKQSGSSRSPPADQEKYAATTPSVAGWGLVFRQGCDPEWCRPPTVLSIPVPQACAPRV